MGPANPQNTLKPPSGAGTVELGANDEPLSSIVFVVCIFSAFYQSLLFGETLVVSDSRTASSA